MRIPDLEAASDEDLVRAFTRDRDHTALTVLLRRHEARVFSLAYRLLGNRPDAADATQEVFVTLFRKAGQFQHQAAFTTWLHRLTVNACHDLGRKRARTPVPAEHDARQPATGPDDFKRVEDRLQVRSALAALPEDQRVPIVLRDVRGLSYQEIAEVTGVPVGTVKSRIARGRMQLATLLTSGEPAPGSARLRDD
ncbi:MAG: sigma-70 family RNA polymerase sigma factor [Actinomycetota bacterium]